MIWGVCIISTPPFYNGGVNMASFDVVKYTIAQIKLNGVAVTIPVIKITVSNKITTTLDSNEMKSFIEGIAPELSGYSGIVGSRHSWAPEIWQGISTGTHTYGNDQGFKLVITKDLIGGGPKYIEKIRAELFYNNTSLQPTHIYERGMYEVWFPYILTDTDNKIYTSSRSCQLRFLRDENLPEIYVVDGVYLKSTIRDGINTLLGNVWNYWEGEVYTYHSDWDITADIDKETDPSKEGDPFTKKTSPSGGGGGKGKFSRTGDAIAIPSLPTLSAVDAGFITLFKPTLSELADLASYMWTGAFDIETFKKIFANPMDCILGMSIVPVAVPSGGSSTVKVGNISTGISMTKASTQYVELDCGSLKIEEYWGAYLDYAPYTKAQIYLPYIGMRELDIDDVMNKTLKVVYHIDILSGACIAYIQSESTVVYSFIGQCSSSVPITGNDWTNVINGVLNIAGAIGSTIATGGLAAPLAIGAIASTASTVTNSKPSVERSGAISGTGGLMGVQTPYLIITWPKQCVPEHQNGYIGYPSFITLPLNSLSGLGFNKIASIHLENISATENEKIEIEALLKEGVIF